MGDRLQNPALTTVWECDPPPEGVKFRVLREEWDSAFDTRTIHAWEPVVNWRQGVESR